jgi:hypothetical protein
LFRQKIVIFCHLILGSDEEQKQFSESIGRSSSFLLKQQQHQQQQLQRQKEQQLNYDLTTRTTTTTTTVSTVSDWETSKEFFDAKKTDFLISI